MVTSPVIKFYHAHPKLWGQTSAELIDVREINIPGDFTRELREYDTAYDDGEGKEYFSLPAGDYLQLIFVGNRGVPFCTLRYKTPEKERYYGSRLNCTFAIEISGETTKTKRKNND
jgi:hypothetical protein